MDYHNGRISDQILEATNGQGVDKVLIAGGNAADTFEEAVRMLKPGRSIGNVNYLNGHDDVVWSSTPVTGALGWVTRPSTVA